MRRLKEEIEQNMYQRQGGAIGSHLLEEPVKDQTAEGTRVVSAKPNPLPSTHVKNA